MDDDRQLGFLFDAPLLPLLTADEIYKHAAGELLEKLKEDRRVEHKSARVDRRILGDYFSMWANTKPNGGLIAVGIENDGRVTGCQNLTVDQRNGLETSAREYCARL